MGVKPARNVLGSSENEVSIKHLAQTISQGILPFIIVIISLINLWAAFKSKTHTLVNSVLV